MRRKLRPRTLAEVPAGQVRFALFLTRRYWQRRVYPILKELRRWLEPHAINQADFHADLRLAALQAACRFRRRLHGDLERYILNALHYSFKKQMKRESWWIDDEGMKRLHAHHAAGTSPTPDLVMPRSLSELTDPNLHTLTHLLDDLPDREERSTHDEACLCIQREQLRLLLRRLPVRCRGPVWAVYAEGLDFYTASKRLGLPVLETWEWANEGLERLKTLVNRGPSCLLPPD